jgi:hypothetical protein
MTFKTGDFWDQVSSYRLLHGLFTNANNYASLYAGSQYFDIDFKK